MKSLNQYIKEKLIINKDYKDYNDDKIVVKTFDELRKIIEDRYKKLGAGTKRKPIDFNDIDVSNLNSFSDNDDYELFEKTKFKYIDISDWDVSNVTDMFGMFYQCNELKSAGDISDWDVSSVTDMSYMFASCSNLNQDISNWDVSGVKDMSFMFDFCESFNQDISEWNVSNVTDKAGMFHCCSIKREYKPKFK